MSWRDNEEFRNWFFIVSGEATDITETDNDYRILSELNDDQLDLMCLAYEAGCIRLGNVSRDECETILARRRKDPYGGIILPESWKKVMEEKWR